MAAPHHPQPTVVTTERVGHADHSGHAHAHAHDTADAIDTMDTTAHERTFDGFIKFLTWNAVAAILVLIFMALADA